jgi:hypothetical protein
MGFRVAVAALCRYVPELGVGHLARQCVNAHRLNAKKIISVLTVVQSTAPLPSQKFRLTAHLAVLFFLQSWSLV